MTATSELEQALAYCEALRGNYILMGQSSEDQQAKKTFTNMQTELEQHILFLKDRLESLNQNNEPTKLTKGMAFFAKYYKASVRQRHWTFLKTLGLWFLYGSLIGLATGSASALL